MNEDHDISVKSGAVGILANLIEHNSLIEHSKEIVEYKTKDQQIFPILEMIKSHMFYNKLLESFLLQDSVILYFYTKCSIKK